MMLELPNPIFDSIRGPSSFSKALMFKGKMYLLVLALLGLLCVFAIVALLQAKNIEDETEVFAQRIKRNTDYWLNLTDEQHPNHTSHELVAAMSEDMVNGLLQRKGLRGFERLIAKSCGSSKNSAGFFNHFHKCLKDTKNDMLNLVEEFTLVRSSLSVRDHISLTAFCGLMPRIVACKTELHEFLATCENYSGMLFLVNLMHSTLAQTYCYDDLERTACALSETSRECMRYMIKSANTCMGNAGISYYDLTAVLRKLTKKEGACQKLVGLHECTIDMFKSKTECNGLLSDLMRKNSAKIKERMDCSQFGEEGKHLRGL